MGYIKYKVTDELHSIVKEVCKRMGIKESELSRTALLDYLRSLEAFKKK